MGEQDPPDPRAEARRKAYAEKHGLPVERVLYFRLSPWAWAAANGLKPLPGREIPPEYRHLFKAPEGTGMEETKEATPPAPESDSSRRTPPAPAEAPRSEAPPSPAEERIYQAMVRRARIRKALSRDDLSEQ